MSNLRICNAISLHPDAQPESESESESKDAEPFTRICVLGCRANKSEVCRFPVHDPKRCNNWLRHFGLSDRLVRELGGQAKLRVCFKHFNQHQEMAKTRIKTTPLRTATTTAATTTTTTATTKATAMANKAALMADSTTIELVQSSASQPPAASKSVTTITPVPNPAPAPTLAPVPAPTPSLPLPQRSHSISSSASSDVQSINSDFEASLPLAALVEAKSQSQGQVASHISPAKNGLAKKRKLYLITEKSTELKGSDSKRKMFVVVEQEKEKKLMIVSDKPQANLTEHLEKFLPEILSCIQDRQERQERQAKLQQELKPKITLPPKKNPTNFVQEPPEPEPAPTPLPSNRSNGSNGNGNVPTVSQPSSDETNINLSPDFRFLMKILPKLERLPEPHKQNVKRSIQIFVEKSYSIYGNKE